METIRGIPVSKGLVSGKIFRFSSTPLKEKTLLQTLSREFHDLELKDIGRIKVLRDNLYEKISGRENIENEIKCFKHIVQTSRKDLIAARRKLAKDIGPKFSEIIDFQILALKDTNIYKKTIDLIREYGISAYLALSIIFNERIELLRKNNNSKLMNRTYDLVDLYNRLVSRLKAASPDDSAFTSRRAAGGLILVARKMFPTDLAEIDLKKIIGIVVERQNIQSHTSILIKSLKIPYLIKTETPVEDILDGDKAILDCYKGVLVVQPDVETSRKYTDFLSSSSARDHRSDVKREGIPELFATINTIEDAVSAAGMGVEGIGLFRTELSFLNADIGLAVDEQASAYKKLLGLFPGKPVVIRTLDLGGEKSAFLNLIYKDDLPERKRKPLIKKLYSRQIEALTLASGSGSLIVAFPMVSRPEDLSSMKKEIDSILGKRQKGIKIEKIPVCAFIETPAAVYALDSILDGCDQINIGTNDLLSLTYGLSRQINNADSSEDFLQPPTIKILGDIIDRTHKKGKKVTICGGITSSPKFLPILIGLGADSISVELKRYLSIRDLLCEIDPKECKRLVKRLQKAGTKRDIVRELSSF